MNLEYKTYKLEFAFDARTSRGKMKEREIWLLQLDVEGRKGIGEVAPLQGLSVEKIKEIPSHLEELKKRLVTLEMREDREGCFDLAKELSEEFPSVRCGLEMVLLDVLNGGNQNYFDSSFTQGSPIPINGLIWMNDKTSMIDQIDEKIDTDFKCVKVKVGALDFSEELSVIKYLRSKSDDLIIRLDANGGFPTNEALINLKKLSEFDIHSIEQPIMVGQPEAMAFLAQKGSIPIALDEELFGKPSRIQKIELLDSIVPQYIVLKPSLLGGFAETMEWIELADDRGIGWWITSALESSLGLSAIAQFTGSARKGDLHQGLGTGRIYKNNFESKMSLKGEKLIWNPEAGPITF